MLVRSETNVQTSRSMDVLTCQLRRMPAVAALVESIRSVPMRVLRLWEIDCVIIVKISVPVESFMLRNFVMLRVVKIKNVSHQEVRKTALLARIKKMKKRKKKMTMFRSEIVIVNVP